MKQRDLAQWFMISVHTPVIHRAVIYSGKYNNEIKILLNQIDK